MTYLFFIASFNAFFFLVLLLQKRPNQLHDRILIFWLLYLGLATGIYGLSIDFLPQSHFLSSGIIALFLLHGPFLYLYVSSLSLNNKQFKNKDLWHFVPFIAFITYLLIAFRFPLYSEGIRVDHVTENVAEPPILFVLFLLVTAISGPVYFYLSYKKYQESMKSTLDFTSKEVNLDWLGKLIPIFGIVWTVLIVIAVIHHIFHLFTMDFCINGLFLSLSAFIILIGYFGLKQKDVFVSFSPEVEKETSNDTEVKYAATKMEGEELLQCCNKVRKFMMANRPRSEEHRSELQSRPHLVCRLL